MLGVLVISIIVLFVVFLVSALPLYFAVKTLGGKTTLFKAGVIMFLTGLLAAFIKSIFNNGWIIAFLLLVVIYRESFKLKWWKAFIVWFIQLLFMAIFYALIAFFTATFVGISFLTLF